MSNTPEQTAYLALLRLPHDGPRSTAALQSAMSTLCDHIANAIGKDPELVQDISEQVARLPSALDAASERIATLEAYLSATSSAADARIARLEEALKPFAAQTRVSSLTEEKMILRARAALGSDAG